MKTPEQWFAEMPTNPHFDEDCHAWIKRIQDDAVQSSRQLAIDQALHRARYTDAIATDSCKATVSTKE